MWQAPLHTGEGDDVAANGLGENSVEAEVWDLFDADEGLSEETLYLVAAALRGDDELAEQLGGDASAPQRPAATGTHGPAPLRAFLRSITVEGFRGIGPSATLELNPYFGITVVSGRNGSGKSSFAEALEFALTGQSYRFANKAKHWRDSWRNLHCADNPTVRVDFTMEPDGERSGTAASVGASWKPGAQVTDAERWSQIFGDKQTTVDALGWDDALVTHRPIMSYDELGGLLEDGPSALYDALNCLLGLEEIADADRRLKEAETQLGRHRKAANDSRTRMRQALEQTTDPRADVVTKLTARVPYDLDAVTETTLGAGTAQAGTIARLRALATLEVPTEQQAHAVATELRAAVDAHTAAAGSAVDTLAARATLLREALELHAHSGDAWCPVCEKGRLDGVWRVVAESRLAEADEATRDLQAVMRRLAQARAAAEKFFREVSEVAPIDGVELSALTTFNTALARAQARPTSLADLPAHVETSAAALTTAAEALRTQAAERATELEDAWAPTARVIAAWVDLEIAARTGDAQLKQVTAAVKWLRANATTLRARRMAPMVDQARALWGRMRHESNVDLGGITLEGAARSRKAVVQGAVDGVPAGALSVMSQGELHALALALFIPRATTAASPFRFLVLDDPIQAMDPAKISGFLDVLLELARTRQVIVFSHDDRLPAAIRARSVPAQLLDVTREEGSRVVVKQNDLPAHRYIADVTAVILDEHLDDIVKHKAAPGLFRMAVEAAAHQRYFTNRARAGAAYHESEAAWEDAKTTQRRVALAVLDDASADLRGWKSRRTHRFPTIEICARGAHQGAALDRSALNDLRHTVSDIVEGR